MVETIKPLFIALRSPEPGKAEMMIGIGRHECVVVEGVTHEMLLRLAAEATDLMWKTRPND